MPLYEYACRRCEHTFETLIRGTWPFCDHCKAHVTLSRLLCDRSLGRLPGARLRFRLSRAYYLGKIGFDIR